MQWLDKIIKFFSKLFTTNSFKKKYRTKSIKKLPKYLNNKKWKVVDIRNKPSYQEHHLVDTINLPVTTFNFNYYKQISKRYKILLINDDYRSHLNIYQNLNQKGFKVYVLYGGYKEVRNNADLDQYTIYRHI